MADKQVVQRAPAPLFRFDPGWLFIAAGLTVCAAGIILPAQSDLQALHRQFDQLRAEEAHAYARLKAHSDFMDQVERADSALVRRLAAAQLNLVPAGDKPVLLAAGESSPVTDWIDATVNRDIRPAKPVTISTLSQLSNGPNRLWMFGGGIMCVFVGLILNPGPLHLPNGKEEPEEAAADMVEPLAIALELKPDADAADVALEIAPEIAIGSSEPAELLELEEGQSLGDATEAATDDDLFGTQS